MHEWEYKRTGNLSERELNGMGAEGWELVGVINDVGTHHRGLTHHHHGYFEGDISTDVTLIFKRRKP